MVIPFPQPSESFAWTQEPWGPALCCRPLAAVTPHLFTSAAVSVSHDPQDPALAAVAASLGLTPDAVVQVHQVHGRAVKLVRDEFRRDRGKNLQAVENHTPAAEIRPEPISPADAIVSDDPRRAVGVRVADCVPILLADTGGTVVAAVHAGWRGTAAGVVRAAVLALRERLNVHPERLIAAIGPSMRRCCYEVGPEVRTAFTVAGHGDEALERWFSPAAGDRLYLDVPRVNRDELVGLGVPESRVFDSGLCTGCHDGMFHSYRRQGARAGRMLAAIRPAGHPATPRFV